MAFRRVMRPHGEDPGLGCFRLWFQRLSKVVLLFMKQFSRGGKYR